jgi:hypothetical protein
MTIKHTHDTNTEPCIWHDGSLADCPESKWIEVQGGRFYEGFSVQLPDRQKEPAK